MFPSAVFNSSLHKYRNVTIAQDIFATHYSNACAMTHASPRRGQHTTITELEKNSKEVHFILLIGHTRLKQYIRTVYDSATVIRYITNDTGTHDGEGGRRVWSKFARVLEQFIHNGDGFGEVKFWDTLCSVVSVRVWFAGCSHYFDT